MVNDNSVIRSDEVSVAEAATLLGVSRSTIYRRIDAKEIKVCRGVKLSIKRSELTRLLREQAREQARETRQRLEQIKAAS